MPKRTARRAASQTKAATTKAPAPKQPADDTVHVKAGLIPAPGARPLENGQPDPSASMPYGKKATPTSEQP